MTYLSSRHATHLGNSPFGRTFSIDLAHSRINALVCSQTSEGTTRPLPPAGSRSVGGSITPSAHLGLAVDTPISAWSKAVVVLTQPRVALSSNPLDHFSIHTPLRHSQFVEELVNHPDRNWVSWLLSSIYNGVQIGYKGSRHSLQARNLPSSRLHPEVIHAELDKEIAAGRIAGPFSKPLSKTSSVRDWVQCQKKGANGA